MLEMEEGSNLRWLVAAAMIVLGMTLVAVRFDDHPGSAAVHAAAAAETR
jgi:hypothetical protein